VNFFKQFIVFVLKTLTLLGQVVNVFIQIFDLVQQIVTLGLKSLGSFFGGVLHLQLIYNTLILCQPLRPPSIFLLFCLGWSNVEVAEQQMLSDISLTNPNQMDVLCRPPECLTANSKKSNCVFLVLFRLWRIDATETKRDQLLAKRCPDLLSHLMGCRTTVYSWTWSHDVPQTKTFFGEV
jgi:hypothetical protein